MNSEVPYKIVEGVVTCCAWCFPGETIIQLYPELTGMKISHGMCATHMAGFRRELDAHAHLMVRK